MKFGKIITDINSIFFIEQRSATYLTDVISLRHVRINTGNNSPTPLKMGAVIIGGHYDIFQTTYLSITKKLEAWINFFQY